MFDSLTMCKLLRSIQLVIMTEWSWLSQDLTYDWMVLTRSGSDRLNVCLKRRNLFIRTGRVAIAEWFVIRQRVGRIKTESFSHSLLPRSNMWVRKRKGWFPVGRRLRLAWCEWMVLTWSGSDRLNVCLKRRNLDINQGWVGRRLNRLVIRFCLAANRSFSP